MNKVVVILLSILVIMGAVLLIGYFVHEAQEDEITELNSSTPFEPVEDVLDTEVENSENIELLVSPMTIGENCVTKTLTAVIIPATAEDKTVDWSVAWADTTKTANVEEYIKVVPTGDGSTVANVSCYKQFDGEIIITVTTRTGGFTAKCVASYIGMPTSISVYSSLEKSDNNAYLMSPNSTYQFTIEQNSILGDVKAGGYNNYSIATKAYGSVTLGYYETYRSGGENWYDASDEIFNYGDILDNFMTISQSGSTITVTTHEPIEDYYGTKSIIDGGRTQAYKDKFRFYISDCYVEITVTEKTTGLSTVFRVEIEKQ